MCRLFGMTAGRERIAATFWLLDAEDSLQRQSHDNPDGTGIGWFDESGWPHVEKQALAAFDDADFALEAHERRSTTFVAHVRKSSGTPVDLRNTHPFTRDGRIFAHNGVLGDLSTLEAHLGPAMADVAGDTDSERLFALITREIETAGGDVAAGITAAMRWVAENLSVMSANFILADDENLWAMRYPATHELWLLERRPAHLEHHTSTGTVVRSDHLSSTPSVVVASEQLDREGWELLDPGVLVHVDADLTVTRTPILAAEPRPLAKETTS